MLKRYQSIVTAMCIVLIAALPGNLWAVSSTENATVEISWPELKEVLDARAFESQEELLQVMHILHLQSEGKSILLEGDTILHLKKELKSLFPLDKCTSIILHPSEVELYFSEPQNVSLPKTWRQASVEIPEKLVLLISQETSGTHLPSEGDMNTSQGSGNREEKGGTASSVHFTITEGYVKIHFSFLLRLFGGRLYDAEGSKIHYQIDNTRKISRLSLIEITALEQEDFRLHQPVQDGLQGDYNWIDILHRDFPEEKDIGFRDNGLVYPGMEIRLLSEGKVQFNEGPVQEDQKAWEYFKTKVDRYEQYVQSGVLSEKAEYIRSFSYYFEEDQLKISKGLHEREK